MWLFQDAVCYDLKVVVILCCSFTHLKRKRRLLIVDPDKDLTNYQLFAVISEHKLCTKAFIIFSL